MLMFTVMYFVVFTMLRLGVCKIVLRFWSLMMTVLVNLPYRASQVLFALLFLGTPFSCAGSSGAFKHI